jgi:hypothetical protein
MSQRGDDDALRVGCHERDERAREGLEIMLQRHHGRVESG